MSGAMECRAAVFTSSPQAVEVFQAGAWWAGELLGWRHAPDGSCQVQVRVTLAGVEETAWTELAGLRLPERHPSNAPESVPSAAAPTASVPTESSDLWSRRHGRPAPVEDGATANMSAVRGPSVVPAGPAVGGRRRAAEPSDTPLFAVVVSRPGGRRRAPEEPTDVDGGDASSVEGVSSEQSGRHRAVAPVDAGRHRAADTGLFPPATHAAAVVGRPAVAVPAVAMPTVAVAVPVVATPTVAVATPAVSVATPAASAAPRPAPRLTRPPSRPTRIDDTFGGRSRSAWTTAGEPEPELLTRPMRLGDQRPPRRPWLDGPRTVR